MPTISDIFSFDGADDRIARLGLDSLLQELSLILTGFELKLLEEKNSNGAAVIREALDSRFKAKDDWHNKKSGGVDWTKCKKVNGTTICIGVEIQLSARSDLLIIDIIHLRNKLMDGSIDVAIVVVPADSTANFLTDRCPRFSDAVKMIREARAEDHPFLILALKHDGPGPALPKKTTRH